MIPDAKPEDSYSIDSMHPEAEAVVAEKKGGTSIDGYEMGRMGKKQELRVSGDQACSDEGSQVRRETSNSLVCRPSSEQRSKMCAGTDMASSTRYCWLRHHTAGHLGERPTVDLVRSVQRRHCWSDLVHHCCLAFDALHDCFTGRDGIYGSHCWRTSMYLEPREVCTHADL